MVTVGADDRICVVDLRTYKTLHILICNKVSNVAYSESGLLAYNEGSNVLVC
jgi:hypothetical protein